MCDIDDAEPWAVYRTATRRAAKDYACDDCRRTIAKGEQYHWGTGLMKEWGPYWSTFHVCQHCHAAGWWLMEVCGGWLYEQIGRELGDHWSEGYRDMTIGRLLVGWNRKWRRADGSLMPVPQPRKVVWSDSKPTWKRHILRYEEAA